MVKEIKVKSILNKHKKRDGWFLDDYSVNPYYGCPFNCVYCYIW
jgi:DNA repair photolyase